MFLKWQLINGRRLISRCCKHSVSTIDTSPRDNLRRIVKILYVDAANHDDSLVSIASQAFFDGLDFRHEVTPIRLWSMFNEGKLPPVNTSHIFAKMRILRGKAEENDETLIKPMREMSEEIKSHDILVISTPMWNFSIPWILKLYIDIGCQPGLNFTQKRDKEFVLVYSSGGTYKPEIHFLKDYLAEIMKCVGCKDPECITIEGVAQLPRQEAANRAVFEATEMAKVINKVFGIERT